MPRGQWGQWGGPWGPPPAEEGERPGPEGGPEYMGCGHHHHHHHHHGHRRFGPPWAWGGRRFGPPWWAWGGGQFGPPWARGWGRGGPGQEQEGKGWEETRTLRPVIGQIMALLRAADGRHMGAIQAALEDTRRRIAAILAEETPSNPPTNPPTPTADV